MAASVPTAYKASMQLSEPMTLLTDFVLGVLCALWSGLLVRRARRERQKSVALWSLGFVGLALASLAAGVYHGFAQEFSARVLASLWSFVAWTMALASYAMLCAALLATTVPPWRALGFLAALIKLACFAIFLSGSDDYSAVLADYGSAQLAILLLSIYAWRRERAPSAPWLAAAVVVSALGALVQQAQLSLHERFNHNDLYHVIQMLGMALLYRGGALYRDRVAADPARVASS